MKIGTHKNMIPQYCF